MQYKNYVFVKEDMAMKKLITFTAAVIMAATAFVGGYMLTPEKTITVTVVDNQKVEELQAQIVDLEAEHTARRVLGNDLAEDAFRAASHDGYIDYRIYADDRLVQSGHIPVMDGETEWMTVQRLANHVQDHFDGQHIIKTELK